MGWVGNPRQWNCYILRIHPHDVTMRRRRGDGETVYIGEASIIKESSDVSENRLSEKLGLHARPSPLWQGQLIVLFVTLILAPDFDLGHLFLPRIFI